MANTVKKKNFRLKKRVRKTFGALFLASAIGVASIPVDNLKAQDPGSVRPLKVTVDIENCRIPIVEEDETIYTTGDGKFQFAYVSTNDAAASNKVAVILGYDGGPSPLSRPRYLEGRGLPHLHPRPSELIFHLFPV